MAVFNTPLIFTVDTLFFVAQVIKLFENVNQETKSRRCSREAERNKYHQQQKLLEWMTITWGAW